jgi:hypothetical protein
MQEQRGKKPSRPEISPTAAAQEPAATATLSPSKIATSLPVASSTPIASDRKSAAEQHRAKRAERRAKRGESQAETSPEPNHTATPNPQ